MSEKTDQEILDELARLKDQIPQDTTIENLISKAKEEEMATKQKVKDNETRVQIGSWLDKQLWQRLKAQAALENRGAGYLMDDAIEMYIKAQQENKRKTQEVENMIEPIGKTIKDIWEEGDEIYVEHEDGEVGQLDYGWWNGCSECEAYRDEIKETKKEHGHIESCRFALNNLYPGEGRGEFLCKECAIDRKTREEE